MKHADFVHLHNHSDYSLLDGASPISGMVERAAHLKMPALALTDHGSLFGAVEFYQEARKHGVKPLVGMEAYVTRGRRQDRTRDTAHHLVLLARDEQGFKNLMKLSSLAYLEGFYYKPRVDHELLSQYAAGLLALSACPKGEIASDLLEDRDESALQTAGMYRDLFGADHFFLEVQNHGLDIEDKIRGKVLELARRTGIPVVATNDCHYLNADHADAQDVLLCIQTGKSVDEQNRMKALAGLHFRTPQEMADLFPECPEAVRNTLAVAERCNLQMNFGKPLLPEFPLPEGWASADEYFRDLTWKELNERFRGEVTDELRSRCAYEMDVICQMGFASYFLIVRDFIHFAKSRGIGVGPGRGSVAGSLVAYALRITDVNPLEHGLIFERFLNPERVSMPDIDIDFDDLRRGEVIDYVKAKYGETSVTQIITFGTMGAKGVVRDVGRALGMAFADVDKIAKLVPDGLGMTLDRALELSPDLKNLPARGAPYDRLLSSARVLEGLARHASTHAAGVLITPGPLLDYVPLYRQKDESVTTQWDMKSVEKAGLLKMDFLGLRTLSVLEETARLIEESGRPRPDVSAFPIDDPAAYKVFQDADTVAIFQFESSGMRDYLRKLKPTVFNDLVAMNALYRPGPMENIPYFIDCKHGRAEARFEHSDLEPILKSTYGVFVYQEQVMQAANALAGFSMAQADELRRAMGKKRPEEMEAKRQQFVEGCKKRKIPQQKAEKIFATMEKFAGYGFNRCVTSNSLLCNALSGERTTVGELFSSQRSFVVHALGDDWKLRPRRVTNVVWNGRKPVFELRTHLGHRIVATDNHPFRTLGGWKRLDDLAVGDLIAAPRVLATPASVRWPEHEVVALAGLISEGNTCHPTSLYFYNNDPVMIDDFASAISQFPETVARVYRRPTGRLEVCANLGRGWRVREDATSEYPACDGNLAIVLDEARRSGAFEWARSLGLLGRKATEKRIPPRAFELGDEQIELLVGRLWSGDGFLSNDVDLTPFYATSSIGLARDVQHLLLRLGVASRVKSKRFRYRGGERPGHTVNLIGESALHVFVERILPHVIGRERQAARLRSHVRSRARLKTSKDTIPIDVLKEVDRLRQARGWTWQRLESEAGVGLSWAKRNAGRRRWGFRRETIERVARVLESRELAELAASDVYWDRIVSIEPAGIEDTYDLTVEGDHNFVADGLIVHNSHSAAYALVAYQCAWLKAHHPAEFMAATLTSEMSDSARVVTLIEECRRMGMTILPPDVNRSQWRFTIEEGAIRFGLGAVRNVGESAVDALVAARRGVTAGAAATAPPAAAGPFRDLFDLASRLDARSMNRRVLESLVMAGACDALGGERGALFAGAARALEHAAALQRERSSGQSSLFGGGDEGTVAVVAPPLPEVPAWTGRERSQHEKEVLGFYFSEHPLNGMREQLDRVATHRVAEALLLEDGAEARLAGLVSEVKPITTKAGRRMGIVTLEDLSGRMECTVFPDIFEKTAGLFQPERILALAGRIEVRDDRGIKLLVAEALPFEEAGRRHRPTLHIEIHSQSLSLPWLEEVDAVLSAHPGEAEVYLHIVMPDHSRKASRSKRYRVTEDEAVATALREKFPFVRVAWGKGAA